MIFTWDNKTLPNLESPKDFELVEDVISNSLIPPNNKGLLIKGNNLDVMVSLLNEYKGKIDLIYIDPPYLTGLNFKTKDGKFAYTDKFTLDDYLQFIYERLFLMSLLLKDTGSIYVHVDYRTSAYIRLMLDEIFGDDSFTNEIIWAYATGGASKNSYAKKHDTLLYYRKNKDIYIFNSSDIMMKRTEKSLKRAKNQNGARYSNTNDTKYPTDNWQDIQALNPMEIERTGYPTQKPEALLERIIKASSNEGDLVADFFCGSGTTLAVAQKLNRDWIGVDMGDESIKTIKDRMIKLDSNFEIKELK
jgi:adenine specific DNA methylase Mod